MPVFNKFFASLLRLTPPRQLTLAEIQRQALDADTLLLEYSLGKERNVLVGAASD